MHTARTAVIAASLLWGALAQAQGYQLQQFEPATAGSGFFTVDRPSYATRAAVALTADLGKDPLVGGHLGAAGGFQTERTLITGQLGMHLDLSAAFLERIELAATLPLTLSEQGPGGFGVAPVSGVVVGDPRVGVRARVLGSVDPDAFNLSVGGDLWIPVGAEANHAGDASARGALRLEAAGRSLGWLRWAVEGGVGLRKQAALNGALSGPGVVGNELLLGAAAAYVGANDRYQVGPELSFGTAAGGGAFEQGFTHLELLLGGEWQARKGLAVGPALGVGLIRNAGTPAFRGLLRITATSALFDDGHRSTQPAAAAQDDATPQPAPAAEAPVVAEATPAEKSPPSEATPEPAPAPEAPVVAQTPPAPEPPATVATPEPAPVEPAAPVDDAPFEKTLLFESNAVALDSTARSTLDALSDALRAHPGARLRVEGYSDATGPEGWNQALSEQRARAVRAYLVKHGIDGARLQVQGFGEAHPAQPNTTPEGRAANRRVELHRLPAR